MPEGIGRRDRLTGVRIHRLTGLVEVRHIAVRIGVLARRNRVHNPHTRNPRVQAIAATATRELEPIPRTNRRRPRSTLGNRDGLAVRVRNKRSTTTSTRLKFGQIGGRTSSGFGFWGTSWIHHKLARFPILSLIFHVGHRPCHDETDTGT